MKKILSISLLLVLIFTTGCGSDVLCSTGPAVLTFEFVDKDSGENLFENGTFDPKKEVTIIDLNQNKTIQSGFVDGLNCLSLSFGWESNSLKYAINIEGKNVCEIYVVTQTQKSECTSVVIKSVEVKNAILEKDNKNGISKILLDTNN